MNDKGSIDFVQLVIGLMIIAIACVGTFSMMYTGWDKFNYEMRQRQALAIARSEVDYIQGRIDCDTLSFQKMSSNINHPKIFLLDKRKPDVGSDDIFCDVYHTKISPIDLVETGIGVDFYKFNVTVRWEEPEDIIAKRITLQADAYRSNY